MKHADNSGYKREPSCSHRLVATRRVGLEMFAPAEAGRPIEPSRPGSAHGIRSPFWVRIQYVRRTSRPDFQPPAPHLRGRAYCTGSAGASIPVRRTHPGGRSLGSKRERHIQTTRRTPRPEPEHARDLGRIAWVKLYTEHFERPFRLDFG